MRVLLILLLLVPVALAAQAETPAESFRAFKHAIIDDTLTPEQRKAAIERYFDFDTWFKRRQRDEQRVYTPEERAELRAEWMTLLQSREFREGYRSRDVRIEPSDPPPPAATEAVIRISMKGAGETRETFEVHMTRNRELHWRWHNIPRVEAAQPDSADPPPEDETPQERLRRIEAELETIRNLELELADRALRLETERARIHAEIAEAEAGDAPYSSPLTTARTLGRAIRARDVDAVLRTHTRARRQVDRDALSLRLRTQADNIELWEPVDVTMRTDDTALVRVRVTVMRYTTASPIPLADQRFLTLTMRRVDGDWLVDESP